MKNQTQEEGIYEYVVNQYNQAEGQLCRKSVVSTVEKLQETLGAGPFMRRYEGADDFGRPEVAFNVCTFWLIDALAQMGRPERAREAFEAMLEKRTPLGLLSEDLDCRDGTLWGNFPQTYSMVGIINGAVRLSKEWETMI